MSNATHNIHFVLNFNELEFATLVRSVVRGRLRQFISSYGYAICSAETHLLNRVFYLSEEGQLSVPKEHNLPNLPILVLEIDLAECLCGLKTLQNHLNDPSNANYYTANLFRVHRDEGIIYHIGCDEKGIFVREFRDLAMACNGPGTGFELPFM